MDVLRENVELYIPMSSYYTKTRELCVSMVPQQG